MSDYQIVLRVVMLAQLLEDLGALSHDEWDDAMAALSRLAARANTSSKSAIRRERAVVISEGEQFHRDRAANIVRQ